MKRFLIAFSRRTDSNTELKFSVKELSDEVSSHALLCPQEHLFYMKLWAKASTIFMPN